MQVWQQKLGQLLILISILYESKSSKLKLTNIEVLKNYDVQKWKCSEMEKNGSAQKWKHFKIIVLKNKQEFIKTLQNMSYIKM